MSKIQENNLTQHQEQNQQHKENRGEAPIVGLSNSIKLHAKKSPCKLRIKQWVNDEAKMYGTLVGVKRKKMKQVLENEKLPENFPIDLFSEEIEVKKVGRKKGVLLVQSELTSYARRCIRQSAFLFTHEFKRKYGWSGRCGMITLSFRRIVPSTDKEAKQIIRAFQERLRRKFGNLYYLWKAELQEGKIINGVESYRMKHGEVLHIHLITPSYIPKNWINRNWNEVVMNYYLKSERLTIEEFEIWNSEIENFEKRTGNETEFLLTPNVISIRKPDRYISKYISKHGGKIIGNLWGASQNLKELIKPIEFEITFSTLEDIEILLRRVFSKISLLDGFNVCKESEEFQEFSLYTSNGVHAMEILQAEYKEYKINNYEFTKEENTS